MDEKLNTGIQVNAPAWWYSSLITDRSGLYVVRSMSTSNDAFNRLLKLRLLEPRSTQENADYWDEYRMGRARRSR